MELEVDAKGKNHLRPSNHELFSEDRIFEKTYAFYRSATSGRYAPLGSTPVEGNEILTSDPPSLPPIPHEIAKRLELASPVALVSLFPSFLPAFTLVRIFLICGPRWLISTS
jgi:hypothetical protein